MSQRSGVLSDPNQLLRKQLPHPQTNISPFWEQLPYWLPPGCTSWSFHCLSGHTLRRQASSTETLGVRSRHTLSRPQLCHAPELLFWHTEEAHINSFPKTKELSLYFYGKEKLWRNRNSRTLNSKSTHFPLCPSVRISQCGPSTMVSLSW